MRNILIWIKRHYTAIGCLMVALSGVAFAIIYKVNQSRPPGEISVGESGVRILMSAAPVGVWIVLAVVLGAGGIALAGYSTIRKRDDKDALDRQFKDMIEKRKR